MQHNGNSQYHIQNEHASFFVSMFDVFFAFFNKINYQRIIKFSFYKCFKLHPKSSVFDLYAIKILAEKILQFQFCSTVVP